MVRWNDTHFPNLKNDTHVLGNYFYCPSSDLRIQGSKLSQETEYFVFLIGYTPVFGCQQTLEEYLQDVGHVKISTLISNEILDPQNFDDPIQTVVNDQNILFIDPKQFTYNNLYLKK